MKLSVSLSGADVLILDEHARRAGLSSRSAAIHQAIRLLRRSGLEDDYAAAWEEWDRSGEREMWEAAAGDGLR
jgi:Arc/MetJ-type ribon-helix-helix transcriptional regulator